VDVTVLDGVVTVGIGLVSGRRCGGGGQTECDGRGERYGERVAHGVLHGGGLLVRWREVED
jgi:hypothetical protein